MSRRFTWRDSVVTFGEALEPQAPGLEGPDWIQANPRWIERALAHSLAKSNGGWWVLDASRALGNKPRRYRVDGRDLVAFRGRDGIVVGPDTCPHMGAVLSAGQIVEGEIVCPWHGLRLGCEARGSWRPLPTYDDGVLFWVRADESCEEPLEKPVIAARPRSFIDAVVRMEAACEPQDVLANRLDPWHGAHYHPYAFARLVVLDAQEDEVTVRVAKRVAGPVCVEVDARFHAPDCNTIVMTIVGGEGKGSVVETHATPIDVGRSAVIEANLASSDRASFGIARRLSPIVRRLMERSAAKLWIDDCAYAERLYELRTRKTTPARRQLTVVPHEKP